MTKPSKFVPYSEWSRLSRGATRTSHPIGSTLGATLHWEGPHMGSFPHSACDDKVRTIQAYHRNTKDWADIAYNALVCPHGWTFEGRGLWTQSAANGTSDDNDDWYAICYIGGEGDPFTDEGKQGFIEAVRWFRTEGGAPDRVNGHCDHKATECPGDAIYRWLRATDFTPPPPPPPPAPVTSHPRWAIRTTGVYETPGGKKLRDIPAGYKFQVIDGSGHGNDGWVETSAGNWVLGADTTTRDPALPFRLSVMTRNVRVNRSWTEEVLPETNRMLAKHVTHVAALQECYDAPDLAGMVPGYAYRYQGYGYEPKTPGYIEERADNVILVRDGTEVKARQAYEMDLSWKGPVLGAWHDPRVLRRVTVEEDGQIWRVVNVHGPFGTAPKAEFLTWARAEFERLAALGDPVVFIGDWNVDFATLVAAMGPLATVDGGAPDMIVTANCHKVGSENLGKDGSDHYAKRWDLEA